MADGDYVKSVIPPGGEEDTSSSPTPPIVQVSPPSPVSEQVNQEENPTSPTTPTSNSKSSEEEAKMSSSSPSAPPPSPALEEEGKRERKRSSPSPPETVLDEEEEADYKEARQVGEEAVDEVISLAEKADALKEHDVIDEEVAHSQKLDQEMKKELEENDGWVKILGNEDLMKKVIKEGHSNERPLRGDIVTIRLEGRLAEDENVLFQNEAKLELQLGDAEVVPGLDLSIPLMKKGEVATLKVNHRFGYGSKGLSPLVPSNSNLIYEVEILDFESEKELNEMSVAERRTIGNRKRERGNWWYGRDEASLAVQSYRRALEFLDEVEGGVQFPGEPAQSEKITPELRELFEDRLKTLNNMAAAQLKLQAFEPALTSVEAVLKCQPDNVKALFRKGKILGEKGDTEKALKILHRAKALDPNEKSIGIEISRLAKRRQKEKQGESQLYKRMFKSNENNSSEDQEDDENGKGSSGLKSALSYGLVLGGVAIAAAGIMAYRTMRHQL